MLSLIPLILQCAPMVATSTMHAIVITESSGNPFAITLNGRGRLKRQPKTLEEAINWVSYLEKYQYNFDLGLAQINIKNVHKYGYTATWAIEPCNNLAIAQIILTQTYTNARKKSKTTKEALTKTISAYNTGNFSRGVDNGYVYKVYANAKPL